VSSMSAALIQPMVTSEVTTGWLMVSAHSHHGLTSGWLRAESYPVGLPGEWVPSQM
jgi:hypothetical protein